jgi:hypothetical protein
VPFVTVPLTPGLAHTWHRFAQHAGLLVRIVDNSRELVAVGFRINKFAV